jgi:hypothetical protein
LLRSDAGSDAEWRRVYDEVARVAQMSFRFKNKEKPDNYVSKLANQLRRVPGPR